jgi:hypothetical protein
MAKYRIEGKPPGAYIATHGFFPNGEEVELPKETPPGRNWVPLDDEAVECKRKLKAQLEARLKAPPQPADPLADVVTEIPSQEPDRSLVKHLDEEDGRTLADLAGKPNARIEAGAREVDAEERRIIDAALGTGGRKLSEPDGSPKKRAADKPI